MTSRFAPHVANPILWADYPDPDVIRVGDWFYMVATSMQYFPGNPILRSRDLVTWEMVSYALESLADDPAFALNGPPQDFARYARGPWACSLRHHEGVFYVVCISLTHNAFFVSRATDPAGPWEVNRIDALLYDPGLVFADGRVYVVHSDNGPRRPHAMLVTELTADLRAVVPDSTRVVSESSFYLEGAHAYHHDGKFFILANTAGKTASSQYCLRADAIYGPYEVRQVLDDDGNIPGLIGMTIHQGGLIQDPAGAWWSMIFQDIGSVGRAPHLQPVTWTDGWPMIGHRGVGCGTFRRPPALPGAPAQGVATSDTFDAPTLGLQWQWNHLPDPAGWSLSARPGWLRLRPTRVNDDLAHDLQRVRNQLTQRIQGPWSTATARLDVRHLTEGDLAGLSVFHKPYGVIGVRIRQGRREIVMINDAAVIAVSPAEVPDVIHLRAHADGLTHEARFSYSLDGRVFTPLGNRVDMQFNLRHFVGNRFGLFCQATASLGGYADFDDLHVVIGERALPPTERVLAIEATAWTGGRLERTDLAEGGGHEAVLGDGDLLTLPHPGGTSIQARVYATAPATLEVLGGGTIVVPSFGYRAWSEVTVAVPAGSLVVLRATGGAIGLAWIAPA